MSNQKFNNNRASRRQLGLTSILITDKKQQEVELATYLAEMGSKEDLKSLAPEEIEEVDLLFGGNSYHKKIYGYLTAVDLVRKYGCQIARKTYHQAVAGPLASIYAKEAISLARKASGNNRDNLDIVEFHTGSGSITYALAKESGRVHHTVDINRTILEWARGNLEKVGVDVGSTSWHNQDALEFIETINNEGWKLDLAMADPPWEGKFNKSDAFSVMSPHGAKIVRKLLQFSNVVGLKAPGNIPDQAAFTLGDELRAKVTSLICYYEDGQKKYSEKLLLFLNRKAAIEAKIKHHQITEREVKVNEVRK